MGAKHHRKRRKNTFFNKRSTACEHVPANLQIWFKSRGGPGHQTNLHQQPHTFAPVKLFGRPDPDMVLVSERSSCLDDCLKSAYPDNPAKTPSPKRPWRAKLSTFHTSAAARFFFLRSVQLGLSFIFRTVTEREHLKKQANTPARTIHSGLMQIISLKWTNPTRSRVVPAEHM